MAKLKVGFLCIDAREAWKEYSRPEPYFGTAPAALLQGFSLIPEEVEVQVKGMIWSPSHGDTAFTVPLFDEFMKRIMPGNEW